MADNDLISRSAAKGEILSWAVCLNKPHLLSKDDTLHILDTIPAVDAVEVVRCRDCKWYRNYGRTSLLVDGENIKAGWCQRRIRYEEDYRMLPDDFCSYGERRSEAHD